MNKLGYNIEFDSNASYMNYSIDFEAMAKHLAAIKKSADALNVGIRVVIFDNAFQKKLKATPTGKSLITTMKFSTKKT